MEQQLIADFLDLIARGELDIIPDLILNDRCKAKKFADIEFVTKTEHWLIEAKSHQTADKWNARHKIFGELLKETNRPDRTEALGLEKKYGLLLSDRKFFRDGFLEIADDKYVGFGELIPIDTIFVLENGNLSRYTWLDFRNV